MSKVNDELKMLTVGEHEEQFSFPVQNDGAVRLEKALFLVRDMYEEYLRFSPSLFAKPEKLTFAEWLKTMTTDIARWETLWGEL